MPLSFRGVGIGSLGLLVLACGETKPKLLPPLGEVVVSIDTDAEVPQFIGRLRVDLFDRNGRWFESRDIARINKDDWPATFSLYTADLRNSRTVLLRARGYFEARVRRYLGEHFQDRTPYVEPHVADTLEELCNNTPLLPLGTELTLRRGRHTLASYLPENPPQGAPADWVPQCAYPVVGGAIAARLEITEAGDYRVETTRVNPTATTGRNTNLFIRTSCQDAQSQIACADDTAPPPNPDPLASQTSSLIVHLERGSYTVIASGHEASPADITLRADLSARWSQWHPPVPEQPTVGSLPRLVVNGLDVTPEEEPEPLVTIDRLVQLKVVPGQKQLARVVLRTACGGMMAKLSRAASNAAPVLSESETCIDKEGQRVPVVDEPLELFDTLPSQTLVGTFRSGEPCPASMGAARPICIPPGAFVLGSPEGPTRPIDATVPERFALMNRFWLDKTEVTVSSWRAAAAEGFKSPTATPIENNAPLASNSTQPSVLHCTYSSSPIVAARSREDFPVTCVDWDAARAFCQFVGGDLPTEAQWEYAATKAGRSFEARWPWGDQSDAPACDQAVFARFDSVDRAPSNTVLCSAQGYGPTAVTAMAVQNDVSPLGVLDLGGNVAEWVRDSYYALDSPCWAARSLTDPVCWEENAPVRSARGGHWSTDATVMAGWARGRSDPLVLRNFINVPNSDGSHWAIGFRCAYQEAPK